MANMRTFSKTKLLQSVIFTIMLLVHFSADAKPPPPGTPKKNDCDKSLVAVNVIDINFGNFDGTEQGTITVTPSGSRSATGPTLVGGTVNAAAFDVSNPLIGCDYWPVRIQIQGVPVNLTGPGVAMPSDTYTTLPTSPFNLSVTPGTPARINVGASLSTGATQASGSYTTTSPFTMKFSHINH